MPDPVTAVVGIGTGLSLYGQHEASKAASKAAGAQTDANLAAIDEQRAARKQFQQNVQPYQNLLGEVQNPLLASLGLYDRTTTETDLLNARNKLAALDSSGQWGGWGPNSRDALEGKINAFEQRLANIPNLPDQVDLNALPAAPTAFDPAKAAESPAYQFLLNEGFRGINEGAAGGGRNPNRDLVQFAQGTAATYLPQIQQQQFNQQLGLRGNALAEQSGLRADALNENQQRINNLLNVLGISQNAAVGAGNAGFQAAGNIGNALTNIGSANAQASLNKSAANQNLLNNLIGLGGTYLGYQQAQQPANYGIGAGLHP